MSEDLPPIIPTFNTLDFNKAFFVSSSDGLTYNEAATKFLKYPSAQGAETLQQTTINGILTANTVSNFNDVLTMSSTLEHKREMRTSHTIYLDTGNNVNRSSRIQHNGFNFNLSNIVNQGAINFNINSVSGQTLQTLISNYVNTIINNNLLANSTSEFKRVLSMNDTTNATNRKINSTFYDLYDAGSLPLSTIGTIYNQSGAMYIVNTFNGGSINLVVNNAGGTQSSPLQLTSASVLVNNNLNVNGTLNVTNADAFVRNIRIGYGNNNIATNTVVGVNAGSSITTGADNLFVGVSTGRFNTSGSSNVFLGPYAGGSITIGQNNTFIGRDAGFAFTTGSLNTFIGREAGYFNNGSNNVFIGNQADATGVINNSVAIGSGVKATASNTIVIGSSSQTTQIAGNVDILGILNVNNVLSVRNSTTTTNRLDVSTDNANNTTFRSRSVVPSSSTAISFDCDTISAGGVVTTNSVFNLSPFRLEVRRPIQFSYLTTPSIDTQLGYVSSGSLASQNFSSQTTPSNIGSVTLGVGSWNILTNYQFTTTSNHTFSSLAYFYSTSATGGIPTGQYLASFIVESGVNINNASSHRQLVLTIQLTSSTTIYFNEQVIFSGGGTCAVSGAYNITRVG